MPRKFFLGAKGTGGGRGVEEHGLFLLFNPKPCERLSSVATALKRDCLLIFSIFFFFTYLHSGIHASSLLFGDFSCYHFDVTLIIVRLKNRPTMIIILDFGRKKRR